MLTIHTNTAFKAAFIASLGLIAQLIAPSGHAGEASLVATASSNIIVNTTGQVSLSLVPSTSILAGTYASSIRLATWNASATVGSLAFRLNPTSMSSTDPSRGVAKSKENSNNTIPVQIVTFAGNSDNTCTQSLATNISNWRVCNQGLTSANGTIALQGSNVQISPGTYPLSMDVAIWAY